MLNILLKNANLSGYIVTQSSSPFLLIKDFDTLYSPSVVNRNKAIIKLIKDEHFKYIVVAGNWMNHGPIPLLKQKLENDIKSIEDHGAIPIIIKDNNGTRLQPVCGLTRLGKILNTQCFTDKEVFKNGNEKINTAISSIKKAIKT